MRKLSWMLVMGLAAGCAAPQLLAPPTSAVIASAPVTIVGQVGALAGVDPTALSVQAFAVDGRPGDAPYLGAVDASGRFRVTVPADGNYNVVIQLPGHGLSSLRRHLLGDTTTLNVDLTPTGSVTGTITLASNVTQGAAGVTVYVPGTSLVAITDANGAFTLSAVPEGTQAVLAQGAGYAPLTLGSVTVAGGGNVALAAAQITTVSLVGPQGDVGPQGTTGLQGSGGSQGPAGPQGVPGATGAAGPAGAQGVPGATGATGLTGAQGVPGATGAAGPIGLTGPAGPIGLTGPAGPIGLTGSTGLIGPQGPTGLQGPAGPQGAAGAGSAPVLLTESVGAFGFPTNTYQAISPTNQAVVLGAGDNGVIAQGMLQIQFAGTASGMYQLILRCNAPGQGVPTQQEHTYIVASAEETNWMAIPFYFILPKASSGASYTMDFGLINSYASAGTMDIASYSFAGHYTKY